MVVVEAAMAAMLRMATTTPMMRATPHTRDGRNLRNIRATGPRRGQLPRLGWTTRIRGPNLGSTNALEILHIEHIQVQRRNKSKDLARQLPPLHEGRIRAEP